ncbi:magnesium/cobalt transporter CorA [Arenicella xantha]|uniref:Magnesium transport protein CorA n=1 Tax=Arenicella xantha TaxID=644221 RepID=A0A395JPN8_9GAMM|nr:magnesium/cobalt transporter CorA [Arenicella xantha]RBP50670.1 magnesium transporter [Arenicella xantha]
MIRAFVYDPKTKTSQSGGEELIEMWKQSDRNIIWLDIEGKADEHDNALLAEFGIHPLAIQDALRPRHPPKIERFQQFLFILLRGLDADTNGINSGTIQLSCFISPRFLITRHAKPSASANWLFDQLEKDPSLIYDGPGALAIRLSNRLARRYVEILLELEPRLDEIEEEMFKSPDDTLLAELTGYKSRLRKLTRTANYHRDVAMALRSHDEPLLADSLVHEIVDLYEQIERTQTLANMYYQICNDLTDGYLGMSSHQLNRVMQLLTIITVIFVPLTFMAGIYGMNFEYIPELGFKGGYFVLLAIMAVVAVIQVFYFRRKRWL